MHESTLLSTFLSTFLSAYTKDYFFEYSKKTTRRPAPPLLVIKYFEEKKNKVVEFRRVVSGSAPLASGTQAAVLLAALALSPSLPFFLAIELVIQVDLTFLLHSLLKFTFSLLSSWASTTYTGLTTGAPFYVFREHLLLMASFSLLFCPSNVNVYQGTHGIGHEGRGSGLLDGAWQKKKRVFRCGG